VSQIPRVVVDASVGVKWFKDEPGSEEALELLERLAGGTLDVAAPVLLVHEVLAVLRRVFGPDRLTEALELLVASGVSFVPLSAEVVDAAAIQCRELGCSFYDALAPACALLLDATLVTADARAHGGFDGEMTLLHG
jgi:predicted nucleic acid-binding protein